MMEEKRLIEEYKKLKREAAPDLWNRIEGNLKKHPERQSSQRGREMEKKLKKPAFWQRKPVYKLGAAAAAILVLALVIPQMRERKTDMTLGTISGQMAGGGDAGAAAETTVAETWENGMGEREGVADDYDHAAESEEWMAPQVTEAGNWDIAQDGAEKAMNSPTGCQSGVYKEKSYMDFQTEEYRYIEENGYKSVAEEPLSTFSVDVDTASYGNVRRMIRSGSQIPWDAVRIEEMINYFPYDYPEPEGDEPFSVTTEYSDCPWNEEHRLLLIGLKAKDIDFEQRRASNFVFLLDVSGSMYSDDKLPLVQKSFAMLARNLTGKERVSIVTYAGEEQVVLDGVPGDQTARIVAAIEDLEAGGATAGEAGIQKAYELAEKYFIPGGNNRVILATDGDLNVGISSEGELIRLIQEKKKSGIHLSVLGVGAGNIKDNKMEALADNGDGNYHYLDSLLEAKKVLVEEMGGTLTTVAKDVKIQVEFNPEHVSGYRLVGYENRLLANEDFDDDKADAGEIGAGHGVTALYEIIPAGNGAQEGRALKYQTSGSPVGSSELLTVSLRYKEPNGNTSKKTEHPVEAASYKAEQSENLAFASAVAEFGMVLRDSEYKGTSTYDNVIELAEPCIHRDSDGYRKEFLELVQEAKRLYQ